jgi:hypothetical protein
MLELLSVIDVEATLVSYINNIIKYIVPYTEVKYHFYFRDVGFSLIREWKKIVFILWEEDILEKYSLWRGNVFTNFFKIEFNEIIFLFRELFLFIVWLLMFTCSVRWGIWALLHLCHRKFISFCSNCCFIFHFFGICFA